MSDQYEFSTPPAGITPPPAPTRSSSGGWRKGAVALAVTGALVVGALGGGATGALVTRSLVSEPTPIVIPLASVAPASAALTAVPGVATTAPGAASAAPGVAPTAAPAERVVDQTGPNAVVEVYKRVSPAVVSIRSSGSGRGSGIGSGFIIDAQGSILTNNHVVQGATALRVSLSNGTELTAKVTGTAPAYDLALIKVDPPTGGLTVAKLGDSDAVTPGELAIAIGSPSGLELTVTSGIISASGRTYGGGGGSRPLSGLIQTDTAINPGNSGGPLLNGLGEVIGINTLKAPDTQGIGFAVPINTAKRVLPQLKAGGRVSAPYLGVRLRSVTPELADVIKLPVREGVLILEVTPDSPAARAGFKGSAVTQGEDAGRGGDVIVAIAGQPIKRYEDMTAIMENHRAGERVTVTILRDGQSKEVSVELGEWPNS